jgi:O-antigen/teichoic acid export membrane protein
MVMSLANLIRNASFVLTRQASSGLIQLAALAIISRHYGPEGSGIYAMAILMQALFAALLNLGIAPSNVYFLGSKKISVATVLRTSFKMCFFVSLIGIPLGIATVKFAGEKYLPGVPEGVALIALAAFPINLLQGYLASILHGLQKFHKLNVVLLAQPIIFFLAILILVRIGSVSIPQLVGCYVLSAAVSLAITIYVVSNYVRHGPAGQNTGYTAKAINYGYKANFSNLLAFINYRADIFLVNFFIGPLSSGVYVIAIQISERLWIISQSVATVLLPRLSELSAQEEGGKSLTPVVTRSVLWVTVAMCVVLGLFTVPLVAIIFGKEFSGAATPLLLMLPGVAFVSASRIIASDFAARGKPEWNLYTAAAATVINVIGNVLLIPRYGMAGAATSTSFAYGINLSMKLWMYMRVTKLPLMSLLMLKKSDIEKARSVIYTKGN